jgi:hypothetical protein
MCCSKFVFVGVCLKTFENVWSFICSCRLERQLFALFWLFSTTACCGFCAITGTVRDADILRIAAGYQQVRAATGGTTANAIWQNARRRWKAGGLLNETEERV